MARQLNALFSWSIHYSNCKEKIVNLDQIQAGLEQLFENLGQGDLTPDERTELMLRRPMLPGLEELPIVTEQVVQALQADPDYKDLPAGYSWNDLRSDLSDSRNWYLAGCGHITPSFDECLRYAKDYVRVARENVKKSY